MSRATRAFTLVATLVSSSIARAGDDPVAADQLRQAAERGLAVVQKAARNYPKHRKCFSCHHQTLPMQAMVVAREHGLAPDGKLLKTQTEFTRASFNGRLEHLQSGKRIDPINVSFGLWALELGDHPADETTAAMITFLLKKQRPEGSWGRGSHRPPLQQSEVTSTVLAVHYMGKFVGDEQRAAVEAATARAKAWLVAVEARTQEDRNSLLGGLALLRADPKLIGEAKLAILEAQREDGGWAQKDGMKSDAYATGQTLFTLQRIRMPVTHPAYQRGLKFLLGTQHADGSWLVETRSKPIQVFFDNGDPHGKHQFISIPATSWGTIALALALALQQERQRRF